MTVIDQIEEKTLKYCESGFETPDFVFLSLDLYNLLLIELNNCSYQAASNYNSISLYTSVAYLKVKACSSWPNDSIIIGDHPIITVLQKLGGII